MMAAYVTVTLVNIESWETIIVCVVVVVVVFSLPKLKLPMSEPVWK